MVAPVEEPYRINQRIRVPEVRLIVEDEAGEEQNLGVMPTAQAMRMAEERELDLVEVAPQAQLPVCKIMDYGRFKYSMERKAREASARRRRPGGVRDEGRPALARIDEHDRDFKVERARGFLTEGHPVRLVVRFLGRDMRHPEVGMKALQDALEVLGNRSPSTSFSSPAWRAGSSSPSCTSPRGPSSPRRARPSEPTASPSSPIRRRPRAPP